MFDDIPVHQLFLDLTFCGMVMVRVPGLGQWGEVFSFVISAELLVEEMSLDHVISEKVLCRIQGALCPFRRPPIRSASPHRRSTAEVTWVKFRKHVRARIVVKGILVLQPSVRVIRVDVEVARGDVALNCWTLARGARGIGTCGCVSGGGPWCGCRHCP